MVSTELVVVGCQSGDEGKGKFTDIFSAGASAVVRFQGGPHTGHTVVTADGEYRFIQLPAGMQRGIQGVLGNGCVIEPGGLLGELDELGLEPSPERLLISENAHVVMPYHPLQDEAMERWRGNRLATSPTSGFVTGAGQLGSTKRGVGPCREDKIARIGIRMIDLLDRDLLSAQLKRLVPLKIAYLERVHKMPAQRLQGEMEVDRLIEECLDYGRRLAPCIGDVSAALRRLRADGGYVVYEGAQSLALDVEHGTYPYCSSGYSAACGVTVGTGSPPSTPYTVVGVAKGYMAQVGGGPLPTELDGSVADHLVDRGREVGTVTGRRRRVGWFDMAFVRKAIEIDGIRHLCLTNIDVLAGLPEVWISTGYRVDGEIRSIYPAALGEAARVEPVYVKLDGWDEQDWDEVASAGYEALAPAARAYVEFIVESLDVSLAAVSIGRRRDQTIFVDAPVRGAFTLS
ncbi:MAG: adenylosuccinate synthase [Solirubrobacterales bacterium]